MQGREKPIIAGWYGIMRSMYVEAAGRSFPYSLMPKSTAGAQVVWVDEQTLRLAIPPGPRRYRLAQLDDYNALSRRRFRWQAPLRMSLRARASHQGIPGTWGFGFWNDPFGMAIVDGVEKLRLPALPNTAWFFFASPHNYLSLREDLPGFGNLAAVFRSPQIPSLLLAPGLLALPLLYTAATRRLARRLASRVVCQDAAALSLDPTAWHTYQIEVEPGTGRFSVDGQCALESRLSPKGRMGLVLWIDNQFAALPPDVRPALGTLAQEEEQWIELSGLRIDGEMGER